MAAIKYRTADVDGLKIFYREAGAAAAPNLLLLHGFPSAGHMFRDLIPLVADRFHVIAPDLPGFGQSGMPPRNEFSYTFDSISGVIDRFTKVVGLDRFAVYVFDYGAPVGFRLAMRHPERIIAIISQNGNAYEEGLSDGWNPIRAYWEVPSQTNREALRALLSPETTLWQYTHGVPDPTSVSPDGYSLDNFYLARPGADEVQLDLFGDYQSNVALYPAFQDYFRTYQPPLLAVWGKNDPFFPARCRGLQARHSRRGRPPLRHRPFRAGDACRGNRGGDPRLPRPLNPQPGSPRAAIFQENRYACDRLSRPRKNPRSR
jgi:pimeloyl-ACP methyl ester carboxylesterase